MRREERHNLALEKLEKARQEWNQKDIERQEKMVALRQEKKEADADFEKINKALRNYRKSDDVGVRRKKVHASATPMDFYEPSDEMKEYMTISIGSMGIGWRMGWSENYF